jgi:hypothetical protein
VVSTSAAEHEESNSSATPENSAIRQPLQAIQPILSSIVQSGSGIFDGVIEAVVLVPISSLLTTVRIGGPRARACWARSHSTLYLRTTTILSRLVYRAWTLPG